MDTARDKHSDELVEAEELWTMEAVDKETFVCRGCAVQVFPVSYDKTRHRKRPHFRLGPGRRHALDCRVDGEMELVAAGRKASVHTGEGFPFPFPNSLVVREKRPIVADTNNGEVAAGPGRPRVVGGGGAARATHHGHTVGSIRPICRAFLNMPHDRYRLPLRVPGVEGTTYQQVFRHARSALAAEVPVRGLFYGPIRWTAKPITDGASCELTLNTGEWDEEQRKFKAFVRVRFAWEQWSKRQRAALLEEWTVAQEEAKGSAGKGSEVKGWLFFVGVRDTMDKTLFHVDAFPMACCLADEMIMPRLSGAVVRHRQ